MRRYSTAPHPPAPSRIFPQSRRKYERVALVLQGGGALGAYQAGVYQALAEANCDPKWIAGVSIGAINSALIAGNPREKRLEALEAFWSMVSSREKSGRYTPEGDFFRDLRNQTSAMMAMALGQPGFFKPRPVNPWFAPQGADGATSYYDTSDLRATLEKLVDFDRINSGEKRLSVGAVNVRTGNFLYFDTAKHAHRPRARHGLGRAPPALPAIKIDGEYYWDGGIVSNTPLQHLLDQEPSGNLRSSSRSTCSARAGPCRARWPTCSPATRISPTPAARGRTPTPTRASTPENEAARRAEARARG